jgi:hypothetical protein
MLIWIVDIDGATLGAIWVGDTLGTIVGGVLGIIVGVAVGFVVGRTVIIVGIVVGLVVGAIVGVSFGATVVGAMFGAVLGFADGNLGCEVITGGTNGCRLRSSDGSDAIYILGSIDGTLMEGVYENGDGFGDIDKLSFSRILLTM